MKAAEIYWNQIEQLHKYVSLLYRVNVGWFAFAATINVTAAWGILSKPIPLGSDLVPKLFVFCNILGACKCFLLVEVYRQTKSKMVLLLSKLNSEVTEANQLESTMPIRTMSGTAIFFGIVVLAMAFAWDFGDKGNHFPTNASVESSQKTNAEHSVEIRVGKTTIIAADKTEIEDALKMMFGLLKAYDKSLSMQNVSPPSG